MSGRSSGSTSPSPGSSARRASASGRFSPAPRSALQHSPSAGQVQARTILPVSSKAPDHQQCPERAVLLLSSGGRRIRKEPGRPPPADDQAPSSHGGFTSCAAPTSRFLEKTPLWGHADVTIVACGYASTQCPRLIFSNSEAAQSGKGIFQGAMCWSTSRCEIRSSGQRQDRKLRPTVSLPLRR